MESHAGVASRPSAIAGALAALGVVGLVLVVGLVAVVVYLGGVLDDDRRTLLRGCTYTLPTDAPAVVRWSPSCSATP
ncbi:MAG: hypothetical protein KBG48_01975 [Kofleriaceae bacterium]|nr:hypothetical protein [Kofleriaceae bacterium]MBP9166116.1 hypothetical protein [Kofleriaceae bacterium]MBP9856946.1 hypothetical protein [Kofleriaceae bacterium]